MALIIIIGVAAILLLKTAFPGEDKGKADGVAPSEPDQPPQGKFGHMLARWQKRGKDVAGDGAYGSSRGDRLHEGVDYLASAGEAVYSPFDGEYVRASAPYYFDVRYSGMLLREPESGIELKVFYVLPTAVNVGSGIRRGQKLGIVQNITAKYPGAGNHIHVETRNAAGALFNPEEIFA